MQFLKIFIGKHKKRLAKIGLFILLTIPVIIYCLGFILTNQKIAPGDADYLMQTQEAARISILKFGQFPWWNPWVSGGVPLFANPQYSLISLQSITTLIFGSILGYKIALVGYFFIGFWGFFVLFVKGLKTPLLTAILLAYIWTFGSFLVHRLGGHYTFFAIQYFPFILYFFLTRKKNKLSWLWLGLLMGLMANTAAHNMTIMSFVVLGLFALAQLFDISFKIIKNRSLKINTNIQLPDLYFWLKTLGIFLVFAGYRLYYSFSYIKEYPRGFSFPETTIGIPKAIYAIFGPFRQLVNTPNVPLWGWGEISTYIGLATGVAAIICAFALFITQKNKHEQNKIKPVISPLLILILGLLFFVLGLGQFIGNLSPYIVLKHLPIFADMRVSTRWLTWAAIMVLLFIAVYRGTKFRKIINLLLLFSVLELFIVNQPYLAKTYVIDPASYKQQSTIDQQELFDTKRAGVTYDENLTATTKSNIGQIIAGDALIDTRWGPPYGVSTIRCDSDLNICPFVITKNADVTYWSPNKISLKRTGPGPIKLNMNPGKYWLINNKYEFSSMRIVEPGKDFIINDSSQNIDLQIAPKFSLAWIKQKFTN